MAEVKQEGINAEGTLINVGNDNSKKEGNI